MSLAYCRCVTEKLTFRDVKTPQEFRQGEDAEIVCNVISSPVPIVTWIYNNREVTAMTDDRLGVLPNGNMQIQKVGKSDEGVYRCEARVEARGEIDFRDIAVIINDRLGVLPNGNMQIQKVGKSDEGVYRCEARVEARGEIDFRDIAVIINVPPVLTVPQKSFNATADRQESVSFICTASGSPEPAITWYRNGRLIEESDQYFLKGKSTELTVRNIKQSDGGPYSCRATNKAGTEEKELLLKVFVQPHITQLKNMSAVEGSQTQISCTAEGEPVPEISWRRPSNGQTFADGDKVMKVILSHNTIPVYIKKTPALTWEGEDKHTLSSEASKVLLTNLEPNTTYDVRVAALNGKGRGEYSRIESFQTLPVREPSPPKVHGQSGRGKAFQLSITKQDDGGAPILEYIVKYRSKDKDDQWIKKTVIGAKDQIILQQLQWNTEYEVEITALNKLGPSEPAVYQFTMPQKSDITDTLFSGLGLGAVVGLGVAALLLVLGLVDVSCFFLKQCGLLMCITRRKDGSKDPIVEMRAEEERITNPDDGSPVNEPNETTPLTEPEKLPLKEENGKETLKPDAIEVKVHGDNSIQTNEEDSKA
ncbi:UNVERIFIED_CONTAM: hypothetical protein FKN15_043319 [Acipenser sinensis]